MPFVLGLTALPGTFLASGCTDERAAASLFDSVLFSFCDVVSDSLSFLVSELRRAFSFESAANSFFIDARSDVRDWRSVTCCLRALMTAS